MWEIKDPIIQKASLNFTSSGQGFREVSQLVSDGVVVMNALELMDFDEDLTQVLICDHCGTPGCNSGGRVKFRFSDDFILMIPAFDEMQDEWSKTEYSPPHYLNKQGTPFFKAEIYKKLRSQNQVFPSIEKIKALQMREAMRLAAQKLPIKTKFVSRADLEGGIV